jgi:hypothetical protein
MKLSLALAVCMKKLTEENSRASLAFDIVRKKHSAKNVLR